MGNGKADSEIKVKFTTEHDGAGADAANKKLDDTKKKAGEAAGGFGQLGKSIGLVKGVMEKVNSVFMGLGILGVISTVINGIKSLHSWINESKERTEALAEEAKKAADAKSVEALSDQYKALTDKINLAKEAAENMRKISDIQLGNLRGLEDAKSSLDEENEIAGIKPDDPDKALKEDVIRKKFSRQRALTAVSRKKEDLTLEYQKQMQNAAMGKSEADEKEASLSDDDEIIEKTKRQLAYERQRAKAKKHSALKYLTSGGITDLADDTKTQNKARQEIPVLEERLKKLEADRTAKEKDVDATRRKVGMAYKTAGALDGGFKTLDVEQEVEDVSGRRAETEAQGAVSAAAQQRERDLRDLEQARRDKAAAEARKGELAGGLSDAKAGVDRESQEAWRARLSLEAHEANRPAGGGGRKWSDAQRALQSAYEKEQAEANAAAKSLEALGESTAKNMETINAKASAALSRMKALESKLNKDPHGDNGAGG